MRSVLISLSLAAMVLLAGCNHFRWNLFHPTGNDVDGPHAKTTVTSAQLVDYLNKNSERLQSLQCYDVRLTASMGITKLKSMQMDARLACEQPRNFRMMAKVGSKDEVDLGSNDQEFWYWVRRGDPAQIYCSYEDLHSGNVKKMPFPFQPDWIMSTLGMADYGPPKRYQLVANRDELKLIERAKSPQGRPVKKIIVFNRAPAKVPTPQVKAFLLVDEQTGREICSAHIQSAQLDKKTAGMLPKRIVLNWPNHKNPTQSVELRMHLVDPVANVDLQPGLFVRRPVTGIPSYNLANGKIDPRPTTLQRVKG